MVSTFQSASNSMCKIEFQRSRTPCFPDIQVNKRGLWILSHYTVIGLHFKTHLLFCVKVPMVIKSTFIRVGLEIQDPCDCFFLGELQLTVDEAQSTDKKTVCLIFVETAGLFHHVSFQDSPVHSDLQEDICSQRSAACVWGSVWIWMTVNAAMCVSWHTNSDMSRIDCVSVRPWRGCAVYTSTG